MQKGEWLPFSRRFSFCILHSAFYILHFHSRGQAPSPSGRGWGEGEWGSRRANAEGRMKNAERGMAPIQPAVFILHSAFFILPFHSRGQAPSPSGRG